MRFKLLLILSLFATTISCNAQKHDSFDAMLNTLLSDKIPQIESDSLLTLLYGNADITILDARETIEFRVSKIPGAVNVGYSNFELPQNLDKNKNYVVYCSIGIRSENVVKKMLNAGFKNVTNLRGGIFDWANKSYPLKNNKDITLKVHGYSKVWGVWLNDKSNIVYE